MYSVLLLEKHIITKGICNIVFWYIANDPKRWGVMGEMRALPSHPCLDAPFQGLCSEMVIVSFFAFASRILKNAWLDYQRVCFSRIHQ